MKKPELLIAAMALVAVLAACQRGMHVTTISTNNNNSYKKVEYAGWITFNDEQTGIRSMAPGSYLKFKTNNDELWAESDRKGVITYKFYGNKTTLLNAEGKQILIQAIKLIANSGVKRKPGQL